MTAPSTRSSRHPPRARTTPPHRRPAVPDHPGALRACTPSCRPRQRLPDGATGGVGQHVLRLLQQQDHPVSALHRDAARAGSLEAIGATAVPGDLVEDSVQTLATAMAGHDAVVFTAAAGGNPDMVTAVDERGAIEAADAAALAGVRRFVLVSVFMDAWRGEQSPGAGFERYVAAKRAADVHLSGTELDWLIIRPGTLTDEPGTGRVEAGVAIAYGDIPRADVAAVNRARRLCPRPQPTGSGDHSRYADRQARAVPTAARTVATASLTTVHYTRPRRP